MAWRSIRMPLARSVSARRPNAPSRSWYSAKRRSTMSIELCQSSTSASLMWAKTPRLDASLTKLGIARVEQDDHRAGGLAHDLVDQLERVLGALPEPDERDVGPLPGGHRADVVDLDLARDHLVAQADHDRRRRAPGDPSARWRSGREDARSRE